MSSGVIAGVGGLALGDATSSALTGMMISQQMANLNIIMNMIMAEIEVAKTASSNVKESARQ